MRGGCPVAWIALLTAGAGCGDDTSSGSGGASTATSATAVGASDSSSSSSASGGAAGSTSASGSSSGAEVGGGGGTAGGAGGSGAAAGAGGAGGAAAICGDGVLQAMEACDDANTAACDGCEGCELRGVLGVPAGASGHVDTLAASLTASGDACYEAWTKLGGGVYDAVYMSSTSASNESNFILRCQPTLDWLQFAVQNGGAPIEAATFGIPCGDGAWHHVAGCRTVLADVATLTLFWDGGLVATASGPASMIAPAAAVYIGGVAYAQDGLDGAIDEVRISTVLRYAGAFTPVRRHTTDADTAALFHLDEGSGSTFGDASGHGHIGALTGTAWEPDTGYMPSFCQ